MWSVVEAIAAIDTRLVEGVASGSWWVRGPPLLSGHTAQHDGVLSTIIANGGLVLAAIGVTSIVGLTVVIERSLRLVPLRARFAQARAAWLEPLKAGGNQAASGPADGNGMARTMHAGAAVRGRGADAVRAVAMDAAQAEVATLERGLGVLATVGQIAPLLGLLGTVAGLMQAFDAARQAEVVTTALLADGIFQALGTTAAGLVVAIPAWVAYNSLAGLVGRLTAELESAVGELAALTDGELP